MNFLEAQENYLEIYKRLTIELSNYQYELLHKLDVAVNDMLNTDRHILDTKPTENKPIQ